MKAMTNKNITNSSRLFLEILQRYWKLVILGTLDMSGLGHQEQ